MRVVASRAMEGVAGFLLAHALSQSFKLTDGPRVGLSLRREHQIVDVVREIIAGLEIVDVFAGLFDRDASLQVTLHTDGIAPCRSELCRIEDFSLARSVSFPVSMTSFTGDSLLREKRLWVLVFGSGCGWVKSAGVA